MSQRQTYAAKAVEILDVAERHMRRGGFDAVSFRDLAAEVGIKSASVHYHFPQKADLGAAVVRRYTDHVLSALGLPDDPAESVEQRMERLCEVYRSAVNDDRLNCLCCVLGAESVDLPSPVVDAVSAFFASILTWTEIALEIKADAKARNGPMAAPIIAGLQGAMIMALATKQPTLFSETADGIMAQIRSSRLA